MYVRCLGEAEAREGAPSGTRDKAGGQATQVAEPGRQAGLPGRGRAHAVLPGCQSRSRPLRLGRSASCFLAVPGSRA